LSTLERNALPLTGDRELGDGPCPRKTSKIISIWHMRLSWRGAESIE
jgi:hypothetical protein